MSLQERLQAELIGEAPTGKCTGIDCPGCDHARLQTRAKATASHIEADLKGLLPEKDGHRHITRNYCENCMQRDAYNQAINKMTARIERYCRKDVV